MKLKRRATGVYDAGPITIQRWFGEWWLIAYGVKMVGVRTLQDARQLLPHVRPYLHAAACEADAVDEALGELETRFTARQMELIGDWLKDNGFAA